MKTAAEIAAAIEALESKLATDTLGNSADFARSLVQRFRTRGLSDKQLHWVFKLAAPAVRREVEINNFAAIAALFVIAGQKLKFPKIVFAAADGGKIQLAKAGDRAKFPGTINVTDGGRYGDNQWFGRIHRDGKFEAGRDATDAITEVLQQFAADPAGYAAKYGRTTGNCCFCQKTLTDAKSTGVGYGPVCAKNYGLAWGKAAPAALEPANQDCPEAEYAQAEMDNRQPNVEHSWA